jgi:hypothetical protein
MLRCCNFFRQTPWVIPLFLVILGLASCNRHGESSEQARVRGTFKSWQTAVLNFHMDQSMAFIPQNVYDYFQVLNSGVKAPVPGISVNPVASGSPGVDLLLRTALDKKVAPGLRPTLTLDNLVQRIAVKHLFKPRDVRQIELGYISINGDHASADIYYQGTLTALRLPFLKQGNDWKIDVLAILPYIEVLMRVDRAIKGETQAQQVERLVSNIPLL